MTNDIESIYVPALNKMVSRLGFGCCPMGGDGWGIADETDLIRAVHTALDYSINFFDTADIYGFGVSEKVLGRALKGKRDKVVIATKFGARREHDKTFYDNSLKWIKQALDLSLYRLQTGYIDLYQIHYWDKKTPIEEILNILSDLQKQGKILAFGVTNIDLVDKILSSGFSGIHPFCMHVDTIKEITNQLNYMYENIKGKTKIEDIDSDCYIIFEFSRNKKLTMSGMLGGSYMDHMMKFSMDIDQSIIKPLRHALLEELQ